MAKRNKEQVWKPFFSVLSEVAGIIIGKIADGLLWGLGFWWAFYEFMK